MGEHSLPKRAGTSARLCRVSLSPQFPGLPWLQRAIAARPHTYASYASACIPSGQTILPSLVLSSGNESVPGVFQEQGVILYHADSLRL